MPPQTPFEIPLLQTRLRREDTPGSVLESRDGARYLVADDGSWRKLGKVPLNKKQRKRAKRAAQQLVTSGWATPHE